MKKRNRTHDPVTEGASAHYRDAGYYDRTYRKRRSDVHFYVDLARKYGGDVLELGSGTGRVTFALARAGLEVVGVDRSSEMLTEARRKLAREPADVRERVTLRKGDIRSLKLRHKFGLVISPFNVFMHLYTRRDLERTLAVAKAHLAPGGKLAFDVLMPNLRTFLRDPSRLYVGPVLKSPESGKRYKYLESYLYDPVEQIQVVSMLFENVDDDSDLVLTPLSQRQYYPAELAAVLHYNGFEVLDRYGNFDAGALTGRSETQIVVSRVRR